MYQFTDYNLTWVNCEMASFIMMNGRATPSRNVNGSLVQSLDVLDFSVLHLSAYERLQRRWDKSIGLQRMKTGNIEPVARAVKLLKELALQKEEERKKQAVTRVSFANSQSIGCLHKIFFGRVSWLAHRHHHPSQANRPHDKTETFRSGHRSYSPVRGTI